jgi:hypothetical protein
VPTGRPVGLLDGEELLATLGVRFSAGMQIHVNAEQRSMYKPTIVQRHAFARWARNAASVGFPVAGPAMIIGVTPERLLVWRAPFFGTRPRRFAGAVPLTRIQLAGVHRQFIASVLTLMFEGGSIVGVETWRTARLRALAALIPAYTDYRGREPARGGHIGGRARLRARCQAAHRQLRRPRLVARRERGGVRRDPARDRDERDAHGPVPVVA